MNTPRSGADKLSRSEIGKDAVQSTVQAAASTVGEVARIITNAVQEVAGAVGGFASEVYEIRDASRKAVEENEDSGPVGSAEGHPEG